MDDETITMYADYACPFCYLGRASLARYREEREEPLDLTWHPFDLRASQRDESGTIVREIEMDETYLENAWKNVQRLADEYGVEVPDAPITNTDSLRAQQFSLFVQEVHPERWEPLDAALYTAVWQDERDVSDPDVLETCAAKAGLATDVVEQVLGNEEFRSRLEKHFATARQQGITGVPTFRFGERTARGAVPPEHLQRLVEGAN